MTNEFYSLRPRRLSGWLCIVMLLMTYSTFAQQSSSWRFNPSQLTPSPLVAAITEGDADKVRLILEKGSDPNALASATDGKTALMHAVSATISQRLAIVKLIIDAGADVNAKDKYDERVLSHAVRGGDKEVINFLIAKGADINQMANYPAVSEAAGVHGLLSDMSFVMRCALDCSVADFISLLQQGGDALKQNARGEDALTMAVTAQRTDIVRAMFEKWNIGDKRTGIPEVLKQREHLIVAAATGQADIINILLLAGANPNVIGKLRVTPLIVLLRQAAFQQNDWQPYLNAAKLLFKYGADPTLRPSGDTPLGLAITTKHHEFVQTVLAAGNKHMAAPRQYIIQSLSLTDATPAEVRKIAELLFAHGARVDAVGEFGQGLLSMAAHNTPYMVPWLLERGVTNVNQRNATGFSPLMYAADMGQAATDIVPLLLQKGADVNAKSIAGWTPLMLAAKNGAHEIVALLIAAGADVHAKNNSGQTAFVLVAENIALLLPDKEKVMRHLLRAGAR